MALPVSKLAHSLDDNSLDGSWVFGHTQKQGGSVLQSGTRALVTPSPITSALSSMQGRMMARTVMAMGVDEKLFNYAGFRPYAVNEVIRRELSKDLESPLLVDPASGFSPQFYWLAQENPNLHCIEIDLPKNIQDKRSRLRDFALPSNLEFIEADLSTQSLHTALGDRKAHVMIALAAYVEATPFTRMLTYLPRVMADDGFIIAPFPYAPGFDNLMQTTSLFRRLVTKPVGIIEDEDQIISIFKQAGYSDIKFYRFSELARDMGKPTPADVEIITIARR